MTYTDPTCFTGPYGRYHRAKHELLNPAYARSDDPWVRKLYSMMEQREAYGTDRDRYETDWPLYARLFDTFEDDRPASPRHMLEALLLCTRQEKDEDGTVYEIPESFETLEAFFGYDEQYNAHFIALYHELFYNIRAYMKNRAAVHRYVIIPLMTTSGSEIALPQLWKLVAYSGGLKTLERKMLSSEPLTPDDTDYLMQMLAIRNCSTVLNYVSNGVDVIADNPGAVSLLTALTELESNRSGKRRPDGFKIAETRRTGLANSLLTDFVKLIKAPKEYQPDELLHEGTFRPDDPDSFEKIEQAELPKLDMS